ncbi:delta 12 fatty acid epoxygenase [Mycena crocata]|nr:delta 12 fatty acid epoxygenase [Mycena crocata]
MVFESWCSQSHFFMQTSAAKPTTPSPGTLYNEDHLPEYVPMEWSLKEIRLAIPPNLFKRDTGRGLLYLTRDLAFITGLSVMASLINVTFTATDVQRLLSPAGAKIGQWAAWVLYWWFQGLSFTGVWVIGHECGHSAFSPYGIVNDSIGFILHSCLLTPFFSFLFFSFFVSWRYSHHRHHSNHTSMAKDEVYVPKTRSDLGLPEDVDDESIYAEVFGDTPIFTLLMLVRQQLLAFPAYLFFNVSGQKHYPTGTNHFDPDSILFKKSQRNAVIMSNIGLALVTLALGYCVNVFGVANVTKYYGIPWFCVNHWFTMITYLHHTDPTLPHYRGGEWNFQRGAAATVDRSFLGWQGRFFLHDVAHFHVIHHFFPMMPFYNGEEATTHLKAFIGSHYSFSDKPSFPALWESYNH